MKIDVDELERINNVLRREYGRQPDDTPNWRVVWANDLTEKRFCTHTREGFPLLYPEVMEVRKYQHINDRYVLEQLTEVTGETDLLTKMSYEPKWTFEDRHGCYLPPRLDACQFIIEAVYENIRAAGSFVKYKDPNTSWEQREKQIDEMEKILFGDETPVGDALAYGSGVSGFHEKTGTTVIAKSEGEN